MNYYAIIVAAGAGSRMGAGDIPKQFMELRGLPVLMHTMGRFRESGLDPELILVLNVHHHALWESLCRKHRFELPHRLVKGGVTRFDSVKKGLAAVKRKGIVAIHDAVRPLASGKLIRACYENAAEKGNAVPAVPCRDSLRNVKEAASRMLNREDYCLVQTPQCFDSAILKRAYRLPFRHEFTDDASVVEKAGETIHLVAGEPGNIKITYAPDLKIAEALLDPAAPAPEG